MKLCKNNERDNMIDGKKKGIIADKEFLYRYYLIFRIPIIENATRMLALFDFRFIILDLVACPIHI